MTWIKWRPTPTPPVTLITDPLFYALAVPAVIALGLSKGGFVGVGQMATPVLALVMPPLEAAAIFLPIMIAQDAAAVWVYRKDWSGRIVAIVLPGAAARRGRRLASGRAYLRRRRARLHRRHHDRFRALQLVRAAAGRRMRASRPSHPACSGARSPGFTSTICQAGGPPYQMYVLGLTLPKMVYVGTNAILFAAMNWMKLVPYFALGQFSPKGVATSARALAARDAGQLVRLLGGARHADRAVLPHHADHHVPDLDRIGAQRHDGHFARLTSALPLANVEIKGTAAMAKSPYDTDLDRNPANYQPLTPLGFLERAAAVFPDHTAIIHGPLRRTYAEFYARARRLGSALAKRGIKRGDTVSVFLANTPAMLECHYGVPMCKAVLNTLNTRLDAPIIAFSLDHADAKVVITDREFSKVMKEALTLCKVKPLVIDYDDPEYTGAGERLGAIEYEDFIAQGDPDYRLGHARRRMGRHHAQLHVAARPAIRRASSITTAARIFLRSAMSSPAPWASIPSICGRCRCSTATAGASRGRSRSPPARMSACARCAPPPCTTRSPATR